MIIQAKWGRLSCRKEGGGDLGRGFEGAVWSVLDGGEVDEGVGKEEGT